MKIDGVHKEEQKPPLSRMIIVLERQVIVLKCRFDCSVRQQHILIYNQFVVSILIYQKLCQYNKFERIILTLYQNILN